MSTLKERMKQYEECSKLSLMRRSPVIIRIDGRAFHTFTRNMDKPFDVTIERSMTSTMLYLCQRISGCVLGYTQSDEISLVLCDYQTIDRQPWFGNELQKLVSVSASMATLAFNRAFSSEVCSNTSPYKEAIALGATFDARAFTLPRDEVTNYLIWRQQDATRNSIQSVGHANFSEKEMHGFNMDEIQEKLFQEKGINWGENFANYQKRGACCVKLEFGWGIDYETPIFTQDRDYIESRITFE